MYQRSERIMECCGNAMAMGSVVCPKPIRAGPTSNFNNSGIMSTRFRLRDNVETFDSQTGAELLDLIHRKETFEAERYTKISPSPPFFFGSPPCRAQNPVVQDVQFRVDKPTTICSSPSDSAWSPAAHTRVNFGQKQAAVKVEGFDCTSSILLPLHRTH